MLDFHSLYELRDDEVDNRVGQDLIVRLLDLLIGQDYPQKFLAIHQTVSLCIAQDFTDKGVRRILQCGFVAKSSDDLPLHLDDFLLLDHALTPGDHRGYLRRIYLVHFAGDEEQSDAHLLIILRSKGNGSTLKLVEVSNGKVLRVLCYFFVVREDPLDDQLPVMIIIAVYGIG